MREDMRDGADECDNNVYMYYEELLAIKTPRLGFQSNNPSTSSKSFLLLSYWSFRIE